ncbi:MAG: ECF transporter S component [Prevotella sp.]|nr:ECF transporter S component [Prevotella sp.]
METSARLYSFNYSELRTYLWSMLFVACNILLPQVFHLVPQGGIVFAPLSLVILAGSYKLGWKTGLLAAVASPLVNHLLTGMPAWGMLPLMTLKLAALALLAGLAAQHFKRVSLPLIVGVVLVAELLGALAELLLTGGIASTVQDFSVGYPGLLLQVAGTWIVCKYL